MPVCHVCGITLTLQSVYKTSNSSCFFECPVCGRYEVGRDKMFYDFDMNHLASYLFYNAYKDEPGKDEKRYHALFRTEKDEGSVFVDKSMVESWYPKTFAERVDKILLYLGNHIRHIGQAISLSVWETYSLLFIDRYENNENNENKDSARDEEDCNNEVKYFLDSLVEGKYIKYSCEGDEEKKYSLQISPAGYSRIDELQKNTGHGRDVFVAMKYGDKTKSLRESIRAGIEKAGYHAVFDDEVAHNDYITPEMFKHIRDSKFVIAELTHNNSGAYLEEGYAMGLGKQVIQICQNEVQIHFDTAQKNTLRWKYESDIPDILEKRIRATID